MRHHALPTTFRGVSQFARLVEWHKWDITHSLQHFQGVSQFARLVEWQKWDITHKLQHFRGVSQFARLVEWHKWDITHSLQHFRGVSQFARLVEWHKWHITHILHHHRGVVSSIDSLVSSLGNLHTICHMVSSKTSHCLDAHLQPSTPHVKLSIQRHRDFTYELW